MARICTALNAYQQAITLQPEIEEKIASEYTEAHYNLAKDYLEQKKYEEAAQEIEQAVHYELETAKAAEFHVKLANAYLEQEKYEEAVQEIKYAVHYGLETARAAGFHFKLAGIYLEQKKYEEAVQEYEQAVQYGLETAKAAEFHVKLTNIYLEQKKHEEAVREYEQAIRYGFGDAKTHGAWFNALAWKLIDENMDIDNGVAHAQKSLELNPDQNPDQAMDTLALGYIKQGRHAKAVELLKQALEKAPDNKTLLKRMQQAQEGLGE